MNKFTKVGISALAGSLASFAAANAVEMTASGSAKLTYINGDKTEVTGNPMGMNTSVSFSGSGEVNGYATTLLVTAADQFGGMSSASLSVDLGDMGKVTFDQGVGAGGISTIDDKTPTANEEVWDGLDAVTVELVWETVVYLFTQTVTLELTFQDNLEKVVLQLILMTLLQKEYLVLHLILH